MPIAMVSVNRVLAQKLCLLPPGYHHTEPIAQPLPHIQAFDCPLAIGVGVGTAIAGKHR